MHLKDKVALITGSGSGIGKSASKLLARHGARVAAVDLTEDDLKETVKEILRDGGQAIPLVADVSQPGQMQSAVEETIRKWGRLDIVFANAGINGVWAPLEDLEPDEWDRTLKVNLKGTFLTVKYAIPYLKKQGGSVIVTSSVNGTRIFSNTGATAYSTSKAGQVAFTKMVALELAQYHIRVNVICPGAIETNISESTQKRDLEEVQPKVEFPEGEIPLTGGEPGKPEQVANLVLFLASDESSLISGAQIFIDGTESLLRG
jgi:NAD(P)-dependent dehydrogenase (short-subunit alcohol dehydrogenase family)